MAHPIFHAEQSPTGGYPCTHNHRTRAAAERCLPRVHGRGCFSMAQVIAANDAARYADQAAQAEAEAEAQWRGEGAA